MIRAIWRAAPAARTLELTVTGHAGAGPYGADPVCAAASILTCALERTVRDAEAEGLLACPPEVRLAPGDAHIAARAKDARAYRRLVTAASGIRNGFEALRGNG